MYSHLTQEQRYTIFVLRQKGQSISAIARTIGVSPSTVSRELRRNLTPRGKYVWKSAQAIADARKGRTPGNRAISESVRWRVRQYILQNQWSPKQISGFLKLEGINISHETIYKMVRSDESGELARNCRHKMEYKRKVKRSHVTKATNIRNRTSIHERPKEADGKRFGDWEMDLITDKDGNAILTMIERSTNFLLMEKLKEGKKSKPLARVVYRLLLPYKGAGLKTITTDNGSEFAEHEWITRKLNVPVYFTDSYSSWQKGGVENTNKLVRQYIPKGTDISSVTDKRVAKVRSKINSRPREKLNFSTPVKEFYKNFS